MPWLLTDLSKTQPGHGRSEAETEQYSYPFGVLGSS